MLCTFWWISWFNMIQSLVHACPLDSECPTLEMKTALTRQLPPVPWLRFVNFAWNKSSDRLFLEFGMAPMRTHANSWNQFQLYSQHVKQPLKTTTLGFVWMKLWRTRNQLSQCQQPPRCTFAKMRSQHFSCLESTVDTT